MGLGHKRPTAYIDSSVISYLAARPSRDPITAARQRITREWWRRDRHFFHLHISPEVLKEIGRGDPSAAKARLLYVESLSVLQPDDRAVSLVAAIMRSSALPAKAVMDATHIAIATVNTIQFLLTWNCTHIANPVIQRTIRRLSHGMGFMPPTIVTPEEILGG